MGFVRKNVNYEARWSARVGYRSRSNAVYGLHRRGTCFSLAGNARIPSPTGQTDAEHIIP